MGTNYYLEQKPCFFCGRPNEPKHIGKSSCGWVFMLHIYPKEGINDLEDWIPLFDQCVIRNEYNEIVPPQDMIKTITERQGNINFSRTPISYYSWEHFHDVNGSVEGPNNLLRNKIGMFCVKHGEGTWDCISREFS